MILGKVNVRSILPHLKKLNVKKKGLLQDDIRPNSEYHICFLKGHSSSSIIILLPVADAER